MPQPIAYNTGSQTSGSLKLNGIEYAISSSIVSGSNGQKWFTSVNPGNGIVLVTNSFTQSYSTYQNATPLFYTASALTDAAITGAINGLPDRFGLSQFTDTASAFAWVANSRKYFMMNYEYPQIVTDGLVLLNDAKFLASYPTTQSTWYNLSGTINSTLINGPTFNNAGYVTFDGVDDATTFPIRTFNTGSPQQGTFNIRIKFPTLNTGSQTVLFYDGGNSNNLIYLYRNSNFGTNQYSWLIYSTGSTGDGFYLQGTTYLPGRWYDTTFTFNNTGTGSIYRNGELINSRATVGGGNFISWKRTGNSAPSLNPASSAGTGSAQLFQWYNRPLTQQEILQNYYGGPIVTNGLVFAVDASNLVSYESGSTTTYSLTGSLSGSLINGVGYSSGNGGSWVFDGVDDYISCNFPIGVGDFTFSVWMKKTTNVANLEFVMGRYVDQADRGAMLYFNGGTLRFRLGGSPSGQFVESNLGNVTDGTWKNIISSVTRTGNIVSYINGVPSVTTNASTQQGSIANGNFIGSLLGSSWFLGGNLTTIFIYNRALSAEEVTQNFNAQRSRFGI